ncbi:L-seryl-tRNA(Sec) selenium transferase [Halanaerobium saccharolyticum]|uniref:L-seryl-tRNA(Sec) selenium transferase n=1 Tax=Halanaerobium saccharolyticum TaxID=43595 RepID=A0A4R7Z733_9FIRM|nr:L-seryl-tRNA(Sec) selenium transferase [Halanaerobium saccharolyticum]RAK10322.1 L-seryl-tRNA(Sec) selenium transferase [Halanaerobium saccharolyticum]TDW05268.1 L-seryl-tRNA(Sec) selenium transferase [Halanaerobium saccharolyticum]TDX60338.1 L-seryl-tRNA(Sec) selenium transferase [Halanaerobium saccharolyticum]
MNKQKLLASIPAINDFLAAKKAEKIIKKYSRARFLKILRKELEEIREMILTEGVEIAQKKLEVSEVLNSVLKKLESEEEKGVKKVINAGGVILHTNLGRSLLAENALKKVEEVAGGYSTLEFDLESGSRGYRYNRIKQLLKDLTGAESAVVVNNNAAAVMLVLSSISEAKEVIIARGEMVEIGGSFRVPEVMESSGAILKEVGSTNKVYLKDYLDAVSEKTGALLKVHTSNYRIQGFTHSVSAEEMVEAAHQHDLPVIEDLGSGILFDLSKYGLPGEPTVQEGIAAGIDILTFSGDKLLGGPQSGIIVGRDKYISQIEQHPLMRALRVDKMTLAALEETLKLYYNLEEALQKIPTLRLLTEKTKNVRNRAEKLKSKIETPAGVNLKIIESEAKVGGGAYPLSTFKSYALAVDTGNLSTDKFVYRLRQLKTPVIARIQAGEAIFDLKTIPEKQLDQLAFSINKILAEVF